MSETPEFDPYAAAVDPATPAAHLADIARDHAALRPQVALHPNSYPGLLEWLGSLADPVVDAALRQRNGGSSTHHTPSPVSAPRKRSLGLILGLSGAGVVVIALVVALAVANVMESYGPLDKAWAKQAVERVSGSESFHESTAADRSTLYEDPQQIQNYLDDACALVSTAATPIAGFTSVDAFATDTFMLEFSFPVDSSGDFATDTVGARLRLFHTVENADDYREQFERQLERCTDYTHDEGAAYFSNVQEVEVDGADAAYTWDEVDESGGPADVTEYADWMHGVVFKENSVILFSAGGAYAPGLAPGLTLADLDLSADYLERNRTAILYAMEDYGDA